jgi:diketogulonate reductase-like aldo/keto reductase
MNFIYYELGLVVIPKTERIERLAENINWLNFRLTKEEAEKIRAIDQKRRVIMTQLTKVFGWVDYFA